VHVGASLPVLTPACLATSLHTADVPLVQVLHRTTEWPQARSRHCGDEWPGLTQFGFVPHIY